MPKENSKNNNKEMQHIIEAMLFAVDEPISIQKFKSILPQNPDARKIKSAIENANKNLSAQGHPFEIIEVAGGFQFKTVPYYHTWIKQLFKEKSHRKISQSGLETLAIIAYKQPITKAEIESIRGVSSDGSMKTLLERRLINISGRSDKPGRPLLYSTTDDFLKHFGLNSKKDLPSMQEFEEMVKQRGDLNKYNKEDNNVTPGDEHTKELEETQKIGSVSEEEILHDDEKTEEVNSENKTDNAEQKDITSESEVTKNTEQHEEEKPTNS